MSATVNLHDLNLATDIGQRTARARIMSMARNLCKSLDEDLDAAVYDYADCVSFASTEPLRQLRRRLRHLQANVISSSSKPLIQDAQTLPR